MKIRFPIPGVATFISLFRANTVHGHRNLSTESPKFGSMSALYRLLSLSRDSSSASVAPILDQWTSQGNPVDQDELYAMLKKFRSKKRYSCALQLSTWLCENNSCILPSHGVAIQIELISKVYGIEKAEEYFNNLPVQLKAMKAYGTLLNCYADTKSVEKAEALFQTMRSSGLAQGSFTYFVMLRIYQETGNHEKFDALTMEMEQKKIRPDKFHLSAVDVEGFESDPTYVMKWSDYSKAANQYLKAGLLDKAAQMLTKAEGLIAGRGKRWHAYGILITQYASLGKKDDVMRLWEEYNKNETVYAACYISVIPSVLKFGDLASAERIYHEWESKNLPFEIRIPNFLVGFYCRKGLLRKAEALISKLLTKGLKPNSFTWHYMAKGYLEINQHRKAVEATKHALLAGPLWWQRSQESIVACLKYLKLEGDADKAVEIIELLKSNGSVTVDVYDVLMKYTRDQKLELDSLPDLLNSEGAAEKGCGPCGLLNGEDVVDNGCDLLYAEGAAGDVLHKMESDSLSGYVNCKGTVEEGFGLLNGEDVVEDGCDLVKAEGAAGDGLHKMESDSLSGYVNCKGTVEEGFGLLNGEHVVEDGCNLVKAEGAAGDGLHKVTGTDKIELLTEMLKNRMDASRQGRT